MAPIDVEKTIEELTLGEKVALTAGKYLRLPAMTSIYLVQYTPLFET
jgi:hypothetical protein